MSAASRPLYKKLAAALLGALAALVLAELGMRTAGWVSYSLSGRGDESGARDVTILCHGDSNVFGLWEAPEESYPGQLERLLNSRDKNTRYKVVNLGVPGMGSGHLLSVIEKDIARIEPDVVVVTIGANDAWAFKPKGGIDYVERPFWADFRLVKAWRAYNRRVEEAATRGARKRPELHESVELRKETKEQGKVYSFKNREGEELVRYSGEQTINQPTDDVLLPNLKKNLARLHQLVGDRLVLSSYCADAKIYAQANPIMRAVATERGIPLVEPAPELAKLVEQRGFGEVFYSDHHPRGLGYEVVARMVYSKLVQLDFIEGEVIEDPLVDLGTHERYVPPVRLVGTLAGSGAEGSNLEGCDLAVEIEGEEPGRDFTLMMWDACKSEELPPLRPYDEIAKHDPLYRWCLKEQGMRGTFDENGNARISLQPLVERGAKTNKLEDMIGTRFRVGYIVHISKTDRRPARWTDGVVVELH